MAKTHDEAEPKTKSALAVPKGSPNVATGLQDVVIVDLTRPEGKLFEVRVYDEGAFPPPVRVDSAFFFYKSSIEELSRRLEHAWREGRLRFAGPVSGKHMKLYAHAGEFAAVEKTVRSLSDQFPP